MQESNRQRDLKIVRLLHSGTTLIDASRRFGISRERVRQILRRAERDRELARRCSEITIAIRLASDLDRGWPIADILDVFELPTATRNALQLHWMSGAAPRAGHLVCLRELMDLVSPVHDPADPAGYMTLPALRIRGIGKYGVRALVRGIARLELIGTCRLEWEKRLAQCARW